MPRRVLDGSLPPDACVKCHTATRHPDSTAFCSNCFVETVSSKFKRNYVAAKRAEGRTGIIAYSGGPNSSAVLYLVREYEQREAAAAKARDVRWRGEEKAVLRSFEVVHVRDDFPADILPPSASDTTTLKLDELFKDSTSIIDLLDLDLTLYSPSSAEHPDLLKQLFTSLPPSSAAAMRTTLRQRVLERYAASRGHSVILTGHSATQLAAVALDAISSGRAWALGEVVAPFVEGDGGIAHLRPLAGILNRDVDLYNTLQSITSLPSTSTAPSADLTGISETFVNNLTASFPATVSTIGRTASKLSLRSDDTSQRTPRCPLCSLPADPNAAEWRRTKAVYSFSTSTKPSTRAADGTVHLAPLLCYACLVMLSDRPRGSIATSREVRLPSFVFGAAVRERELRGDSEEEVDVAGTDGKDDERPAVDEIAVRKGIAQYLL